MADKFTGTADAGTTIVGIPSNILKFHTNDVLYEAMPVLRFDQFAVVITDLEKNPGDTISFSKYGNLTGDGVISSEEDDIETEALTKDTITITVVEKGHGVGLTTKFMTLSFMNELEQASISLGRHYAKITDLMLRDALFSGTQTLFANSRTAQKDIVSGDTLKRETIEAGVEVLETASVPKYVDQNGEFYAGYCHPHQAKSFRSDMIEVRKYAYPELIYKGEIGEHMGVRWISTAHCPNGAAATTHGGYDETLVKDYQYGATAADKNSIDLYKAVIFGENSYGWAVALPVELREDITNTNFGRRRKLAWYSIMGAGKINNENILIIVTG